MNSQAASAEVNDSIRLKGEGGCLQQACSAATVREALQRCATMDDGWASSALHDAEQCEKSDHPAIRARAAELRSRAENYKLAAARYRSAFNWLVG